MDNAGGTFATRNTYAGLLSERFGRVLLGRDDTPYNSMARRLDPFIDTIADSQPLMGGTTGVSATQGFAGHPTNAVLYINGTIEYVNSAETNTLAAQAKSSIWSMAGWYSSGPVYAALAQETHRLNNLTGHRESSWKLAVGYLPDRFSLGFFMKGAATTSPHQAPTNGAIMPITSPGNT